MSYRERSSSASTSSSWRNRQPSTNRASSLFGSAFVQPSSNRVSSIYAPSPSSSRAPSYGPSSLASLQGVSTGGSVLPTSSSARGEYYNNNQTPTHMGVPITTIIATGISLLLNAISIILIFCVDCPLKENQVSHYLAFLFLAECCLVSMLVFNFYNHHYRYTCISLTLSWFYSGSATLLIYGEVLMLFQGFCAPSRSNYTQGSIIISGVASNYAIFMMSAFSVASQMVAHYYYG